MKKACNHRTKPDRQKKPTKRGLAEARGRVAWRKLIASKSGNISWLEAAKLLEISKATVLRKYQEGELLGWKEVGKNTIRFPRWQFEAGKLLPGLANVISALNRVGYLDDKARVLFFLSEFGFVACRPLDLLREGRAGEALLAARSYTE